MRQLVTNLPKAHVFLAKRFHLVSGRGIDCSTLADLEFFLELLPKPLSSTREVSPCEAMAECKPHILLLERSLESEGQKVFDT